MDKQFRRILDLVRRTGDRMVVTDSDGENVYVVMDVEAYEALVEMEGQVFDQLASSQPAQTPDIGNHSEIQARPSEDVQAVSAQAEPRVWDHMATERGQETWDISQLSPEELADLEQKFAEHSNKMKKAAQQEVSTNVTVEDSGTETGENAGQNDDEDDFGEEQFYLEPIE